MNKNYLDLVKKFDKPRVNEGYSLSKDEHYQNLNKKKKYDYNKPLHSRETELDVEQEFWKYLASLNWKWGDSSLDTTTWKKGNTELILVCPNCDIRLSSIPVKVILFKTTIQTLAESSKPTIKKHIEDYSCKAISEDIPE